VVFLAIVIGHLVTVSCIVAYCFVVHLVLSFSTSPILLRHCKLALLVFGWIFKHVAVLVCLRPTVCHLFKCTCDSTEKALIQLLWLWWYRTATGLWTALIYRAWVVWQFLLNFACKRWVVISCFDDLLFRLELVFQPNTYCTFNCMVFFCIGVVLQKGTRHEFCEKLGSFNFKVQTNDIQSLTVCSRQSNP